MMYQRNQKSDSRKQIAEIRTSQIPAFSYLLSDFNFRAALLLFALGAACTLCASYAFDFTCRTDTIQQVAPGAVAEFTFTLTNTGTEPDGYEFDCRVMQSVPAWYVTYCVGFS